MNLHEALIMVLSGERLTGHQARAVFSGALSEETDPVLFGGFLTALAARGETAEEIAGAADALRDAAVPFEHPFPEAVDTCGTGGDGLGMFNVSTASAIVAAAAGARVVKHGNRSVSSSCGSADLLEAAGVALEISPEGARTVLEEVGITFLFAPRYHPAMRFAAPVRKSLGVRTVFNYLGPLCNPGRVRRQLLGVSDPARIGDFALALTELGAERAMVVHGAGGADELTLAGENYVSAIGVSGDALFDARSLGLEEAGVEALAGGDAARNLDILGKLLEGELQGPLRDAVRLNAAAALFVAGVAGDPAEGLARATEALESGAAQRTLGNWVEASGRAAG